MTIEKRRHEKATSFRNGFFEIIDF